MKKLILLMIVVCLALNNNPLFAQAYSIPNIKKNYSRGSGPIVKNNQVNGYFYFNLVDKLDKKTNLYQLTITDNNFKTVASKDITGPSNLIVLDAAFNEDYLAVKLLDYKSKVETQSIRLYDNSAKEIKTVSLPFDIKAALLTNSIKLITELEASDLHPINGVGFINLTSIETKGGMMKRTGVTINMIPNNTTSGYKSWKYSTEEKVLEVPEFLGYNSEVAFFSMMRRESREVQYTISAMDLKTGKVRFNKEFTDDKYVLDVISINEDEKTKNTFLFGSLTEDEKKGGAKTLGMFVARIDNDGNIKQKSTFLWKDMAKDFKPVDEKGQPVNIGNVFIHKVITNADGRIYAIGERFYKAADGMGIAMNVLGALGGSSPTASVVKIVVEELVIIELDQDLKPINLEIIDKGKNSVTLPAGAGMFGSAVLGPYTKLVGGFDYQFTQIFDENEGFTSVYSSNVKKERFVNTYTVLEGVKTSDKISLKTESSKLYIFPAKAGYLAIMEYFKKEKKLDSRLEKYKH